MNWTEEQLQAYYRKQNRKNNKLPVTKDKPQKNKFNNKKTTVQGKLIDSLHEAKRYKELLLLEKAGEITALQTQVKFLIEKGNSVNRAVYYNADFVYLDCKSNSLIVEDAKGVKTRTYINKKKAMFNKYGIEVQEV